MCRIDQVLNEESHGLQAVKYCYHKQCGAVLFLGRGVHIISLELWAYYPHMHPYIERSNYP